MFNFLKMKKYFENKGISQKEICQQVGISEPALSLIFQGKRKCSVDEYAMLCNVAGCDYAYFIDDKCVA